MLPTDTAADTPWSSFGTDFTALSAAEAALARRSVRRFTDESLPHELVTELLRLTGRAPSAFNAQPWRFIVVREPALRAELSAAAYNQQQIVSAPVVIAMYSDMNDVLAHVAEVVNPGLPAPKFADTVAMLTRTFGNMTPDVRAAWGNAQANIALGYMLLLAKTLGLDTSPMLGFQPEQVKSLLGIPASATITALVALGNGAEEGFVSHRHEPSRITTFR